MACHQQYENTVAITADGPVIVSEDEVGPYMRCKAVLSNTYIVLPLSNCVEK